MIERKEINYKFFNPSDTNEILSKEIEKIGMYEFDRKKNKQERKNWKYVSSDFLKNPALIFSKLIPYSDGKDEDENKDKYLELVIVEMEKFNKEKKFNLLKRHSLIVKSLENTGFRIETIESRLSWRMVIGLGASHPQETSMTLHHIYGIPYIPGSAVKGVTRHWVILSKFGNDEKKAEEDEDFRNIFGTQAQAGKVIFFDAYPVDEIKLKIDIMNPHYQDYYSKGEPPADWQNPTPIKFLTVEKTKFSFSLACRDEDLLQKATNYLKEALRDHGVGAKTALGYGLFGE